MLSGEIDIKPYKKKDITPCSYCEYTAICQFDPTLKENTYKIIKDKKDKEIWELLSNEVNEAIGTNEDQEDIKESGVENYNDKK